MVDFKRVHDFSAVEQLVYRDLRNCELASEDLVEKRRRTTEVRDFPTRRALAQMDAKLEELTIQYRTLRTVAAYFAGLRGLTGPTVVEDWMKEVWAEQVGDRHAAATLTGGGVPAHVPGAYTSLSCCGGPVELVDSPAGAGESVEAFRG